jgi:hypothetical protein
MEINNLNDDFSDLESISVIGENDINDNNDYNDIQNNFNDSLLSSIESLEQDQSHNHSHDEIIINTEIIKKKNKKRNKDELNLTPLPIFSCIYCSNDKVAFSHLSREVLSEKYLFQTSNYDIQELEKIINDSLIEKDNQENKLIKIIIEYSEYLKKNCSIEESKNFFMCDNYKLYCINNEKIIQNNFVNKIELNINRKKNDQIIKGIHIPKNSTKSLFNTTNSLVNNIVALGPETNINNNKNISNISDSNFNSLSLNYDNSGNNNNIKMLNVYSIGMDSIVENIDNDSSEENEEDNDFLKIFRFDLRRKINRNDIIWDDNCFDIWNPQFCDDDNNNKSHFIKSSQSKKDLVIFDKRLLKNKSNKSNLIINNQYNYDSNKLKQNIYPPNNYFHKHSAKNQNLEKLFIDKFENIERRNKSNFMENTYKTNKTLSKIKDYINELNSKNQGSTQSDSKIFSFSQNRNSFLDKNRSSFLNQNSFNLNSLLNQNLSQNYHTSLNKVEQIKMKSNIKKNDRIKKKVEDLIDIIKSPNKRNFNLNDNGKINSILSTTFQKINIKIAKNKYNSIIGSSFFDN